MGDVVYEHGNYNDLDKSKPKRATCPQCGAFGTMAYCKHINIWVCTYCKKDSHGNNQEEAKVFLDAAFGDLKRMKKQNIRGFDVDWIFAEYHRRGALLACTHAKRYFASDNDYRDVVQFLVTNRAIHNNEKELIEKYREALRAEAADISVHKRGVMVQELRDVLAAICEEYYKFLSPKDGTRSGVFQEK